MKISNEIKKYIMDYKFNSLFFKNLKLLFLLIIVPILGTVVLTYYSYSNIQRNEVKAYNESIIADTLSKIENIIKDAKTQLVYIGFNSNVELYMYDTKEIREFNYKIKNISDLIRLPVVSKNYMEGIYILSNKNNKVITVDGISDYSTFEGKEFITQYVEQDSLDKKQILLTENKRSGFAKKQLSIFQDISYGSKLSGLVVMNIDLSELKKELKLNKGSKIYITDGSKIILSDDIEQVGQPVDTIKNYNKLSGNSTIITKDYCMAHKISEEYGIEILSYFDLQTYQSKLSTFRNFMMVFIIVMVFITVGLGAFISIRLFTPIGTILSSIKEYSGILIGDDNKPKGKDELMYILNSIKTSADKKKNVDEELAERIRLLKKAQSVALQSQINPHFMNNTLETINWMAIDLLGGKNEISEITTALSKMMRMTLENTDTIISLKTEMEHCKSYIEIQKKRYDEKFEVVWIIPKELNSCKTICIVLQPIIENAIYHGIKRLSNKGMIVILGQVLNGTIELSVQDNGLGMTVGEVTALNKNMKSDMIKESEHIGVTNVNQRLKLYFGEEYGIAIESREGIGTNVIIKFPYIID